MMHVGDNSGESGDVVPWVTVKDWSFRVVKEVR